MNIKRHSKGFTLVELLVVIAIIGILAVVTFVAVNPARQKARDARRLSDIHNIQTAIELYRDDHSGNAPGNGTWVADLSGGANPYMAQIPCDPSNACASAGAGYTFSNTNGTAATYYISFTTEGNTSLGAAGTWCATSVGTSASPCSEK